MSDDRPEQGELPQLYSRRWAYDSVLAVLADDRHDERGLTGVQEVTGRVLAESGVDGLAEVGVELALKLAAALERIAGEQGIAAVDLADTWFA